MGAAAPKMKLGVVGTAAEVLKEKLKGVTAGGFGVVGCGGEGALPNKEEVALPKAGRGCAPKTGFDSVEPNKGLDSPPPPNAGFFSAAPNEGFVSPAPYNGWVCPPPKLGVEDWKPNVGVTVFSSFFPNPLNPPNPPVVCVSNADFSVVWAPNVTVGFSAGCGEVNLNSGVVVLSLGPDVGAEVGILNTPKGLFPVSVIEGLRIAGGESVISIESSMSDGMTGAGGVDVRTSSTLVSVLNLYVPEPNSGIVGV
jgi:hypothetical protein